jgi:hypothetical protein
MGGPSASVVACGSGGIAKEQVRVGGTNLTFKVHTTGRYFVIAHWTISGALRYNITYNGTPNGTPVVGYGITSLLLLSNHSTSPSCGRPGHGISGGVGYGYPITSGTGALYFNATLKPGSSDFHLVAGQTYYVSTCLGLSLPAEAFPPPGGSTASGTLYLYSGTLGAKLVSLSVAFN